jgi:hypothetical protein
MLSDGIDVFNGAGLLVILTFYLGGHVHPNGLPTFN